ncbi:MAG: hypothetical protein K6F91_06870, partial [Ruminococcus sp.]|nr:hypothetical protein [Ruminococcus sp.]
GRNVILLILVTAMTLWLGFGTAPLMLSSQTLWKYPFQRAYIGLYHNITEPDWFPDFEGDVKGEYEFDYLASMLQGTGHYSVYFETDEETVKRYNEDFSKQAKYSFELSQYESGSIYDGSIPELDKKRAGNEYIELDLYLGKHYGDVSFGDIPEGMGNVTVYVLDSNLDFDKPHTSAVFIDSEKNTVFLSRLG